MISHARQPVPLSHHHPSTPASSHDLLRPVDDILLFVPLLPPHQGLASPLSDLLGYGQYRLPIPIPIQKRNLSGKYEILGAFNFWIYLRWFANNQWAYVWEMLVEVCTCPVLLFLPPAVLHPIRRAGPPLKYHLIGAIVYYRYQFWRNIDFFGRKTLPDHKVFWNWFIFKGSF